jgi:hypothetical protein
MFGFLSSATTNPAKKQGRELVAPPTEGTAKRPCGEARQAAPDGARTGGLASAFEKFAVFR